MSHESKKINHPATRSSLLARTSPSFKTTRSSRTTRRAGLFALALFCLCSLLASCNAPFGGVKLREDPVISMKNRYGVVNYSYVRVKQSPSSSAEDAAYVRQADIVEVHECQMGTDTLDEERGYWYRVTADKVDGWVYSGYLSIYNYRSQADRASRALKEKSGK
jgi:hypothetical protein